MADPVFQGDFGFPSHGKKLGHIEKLARCAVGFGSVEDDFALESDHTANDFCEFADSNIFAASDVKHFAAGGLSLEEEEASVS